MKFNKKVSSDKQLIAIASEDRSLKRKIAGKHGRI